MMLSVEDARARMLDGVVRLSAERVALEQLARRTLATTPVARHDQPPFDAAVMDGYAFAASDVARTLTIVGEAAAGKGFNRPLSSDEAIRISTGAPLPIGADAVLAQEEAALSGQTLAAPALTRGAYVRPRGCDFRPNDALLADGRLLDAGAITLLSGAGYADAMVTRMPVVKILSNGNELGAPGGELAAHQIYDSASYGVAALAREWGAQAERIAALGDDMAAISKAAANAAASCDILVVIGGASVGPHDHVRPAILQLGAEMLIQGIAVRPGKPTWFARMPEAACILGLPGNPASALVCARLFLAALIETMLSGRANSASTFAEAILTDAMRGNGDREAYIRGVQNSDRVTALYEEDSSLMRVLARSNCLIRRAPGATPAAAGDTLHVMRWSRD